jgi:hypothetical protein
MRIQTSNSFDTFASSSKDFAWVSNPMEMQGKSLRKMAEDTGLTEDYINKSLKENENTLYIDFMMTPANADVRSVSWENISDIFQKKFDTMIKGDSKKIKGEVGLYDSFKTDYPQLLNSSGNLDAVATNNYFSKLSRVKLENYNLQEKTFIERYVYQTTGANELFSGNGYVVSPKFEMSINEYGYYPGKVGYELKNLNKKGYIIKRVQVDENGTLLKILTPSEIGVK